MLRYLLFDLDGTLTDPREGITTCVRYALESFGIEETDPARLERFIGPPLMDSFRDFYGMNEEQAAQAVIKYRERYAPAGIFENELYPGIETMLRHLKEAGRRLAVASSKPGVFVEKILRHFHIYQYFDCVVGSGLDGSLGTKEEVVEEVLKTFFPDGNIDRESTAMVGDRKYDIAGARQFGLIGVAVTFGYAPEGELEAAKADALVDSVEELERLLLAD